MPSDDDIASINREDETGNVEYAIAEFPAMSERSAYLPLFHFAKPVFRMASDDIEQCTRLPRILNEARAPMIEIADAVAPPIIRERPLIAAIHDALPWSRGRLKNR
jgi:hypothetical protein